LRLEQLRLQYHWSARTIRESLFRLLAVGLANFQEQRGFRVPEESNVVQHELAQWRILPESEGACLFIQLERHDCWSLIINYCILKLGRTRQKSWSRWSIFGVRQNKSFMKL